jgi:hypothetical protein
MGDDAIRDGNVIVGVKAATIIASTVYPIVSAYEFEFLKEEEVLRQRMDNCTIYMIVQRPLTYFDNVRTDDCYLYFEITDGLRDPLRCRINLVVNEICAVGEAVDLGFEFFSRNPGKEQPFRDVGAIKIYRKDGSFVLWWSPQKLLYEYIVNDLIVETIGDATAFLDFRVLYIGKAFSQKIWERLTGHEKMQKILTMEGPIGASPEARAPFEISLILLRATDFDEVLEFPHQFMAPPDGSAPILHSIDLDEDGALERFLRPFAGLGDEALTRDVEAQLIRWFKPPYNKVTFDNYPDIKGGMRSKGYSFTELEIDRLPASLYTDHGSMTSVFVTAEADDNPGTA